MLIRLDLFVHGRIMNPLFAFVQKWLHMNRYFIVLLALAWTVLSFLGMIVSQIDHFIELVQTGKWTLATGWTPPFIALFFMVLFWDMWLRGGRLGMWMTALREASERIESGKASRPATCLIHLAHVHRARRLDLNLVFIIVTLLDMALLLVRPEAFIRPIMWISSWSLLLGQLVMMHAQDANDIDPRDRVTFRQPEPIKQRT